MEGIQKDAAEKNKAGMIQAACKIVINSITTKIILF